MVKMKIIIIMVMILMIIMKKLPTNLTNTMTFEMKSTKSRDCLLLVEKGPTKSDIGGTLPPLHLSGNARKKTFCLWLSSLMAY